MSIHSESIQNFVSAYLGLTGVRFDPAKDSKPLLSVGDLAKLEGAYTHAYSIQFNDSAWKDPVRAVLHQYGQTQPQTIVTSNGQELTHLFGPRVIHDTPVIRLTQAELMEPDRLADWGDTRNLATANIGTSFMPAQSVDLCLDVSPALNMTVKEAEIIDYARILKSAGLAMVSVPKLDHSNTPTQKSNDIIRFMQDNDLQCDKHSVIYLPNEILVYGVK